MTDRRPTLLTSAESLLHRALERARELTDGGRAIDEHQILTRRLARMATRIVGARSLAAEAREACAAHPERASTLGAANRIASADAAREVIHTIEAGLEDFGLHGIDVDAAIDGEARAAMREATRESETRALGRAMLDLGPDADAWGADETEETRELRAVVRRFARQAVAPHAERIHRETLLIPESVIHGAAELGLFGMSIPEEFGGAGGSASMTIAATEELSAVSLVAGSLITRPEILARALLVGGTDEQKRRRLPEIASGRKMVAVSVTEPDAGSDVAAIACRAAPATVDGRAGFRIDGAKAWSTFAGRAELIALLARTEPRPDAPYRGLSLFIVEKPPSFDRGFEFDSPGGGRLTGRADATLGYRGMHSFSLAFRDWFVPAEDLIGGERGLGRGFHLQMEGFAAGRLQTGGRGVGLARGALDATIDYVKRRAQFGRPIADFQNTQFEIGAMTVRWAEARALTLRAARAMERNEPNAPHLAAMAKLAASRAAVRITQRAQILHGGWGYAEEFAICRLVADALVLPIFEGVEPVLELKVVGRGLLGGSSWL